MIYLGGDKHGLKTIRLVSDFLTSRNIEFINLGVQEEDEEMKLEELLPKISKKVLEDDKNSAILSCGTGVGIEVGINKFSGIRACLAQDEKIAEYPRVYDDCNVLCLVGWDTDEDKVTKIMNAWIKSCYDGNQERRQMLDAFDVWGGKL